MEGGGIQLMHISRSQAESAAYGASFKALFSDRKLVTVLYVEQLFEYT
jgi:hypothetical protein